MIGFTKFFVLSVACAVAGAVAIPDEAPEPASGFVPGEGLPTLEELGLTAADLLKPIPEETMAAIREKYGSETMTPYDNEESESGLVKRADREPFCYYEAGAMVPLEAALTCYNYLNSLGTTACRVPKDLAGVSGHITMCRQSGQSAYVVGQCFPPNCPASSYCRDVAGAVAWVMMNCNNGANRVGGMQAAVGNGHLLVTVRSWPAPF